MIPNVTFPDDGLPAFTIPHVLRAESMNADWLETNDLSEAMIGENITWMKIVHETRNLGQENEVGHTLYAHPDKPMMLAVRDEWIPPSGKSQAVIVELTADAMWPRPRTTIGQNNSDADAGDNAHPIDDLPFVISPGKPNLFGEDARREIKRRTALAQQ